MQHIEDEPSNRSVLVITPENADKHPWLMDFLSADRTSNRRNLWDKEVTYQYEGRSFQFSQTILARKKKKGNGFVYEMINKEAVIGAGVDGAVYQISKTIGEKAPKQYRVRNKNRVVKYPVFSEEARLASLATHLHAKPVTTRHMVMKKKPGTILDNLVRSGKLSNDEYIELTKAVLYAIKNQLADKHIIHDDLHPKNILVKVDMNKKPLDFEINIIDLSRARYDESYDSSKKALDVGIVPSFILKNYVKYINGIPINLDKLKKAPDVERVPFYILKNYVKSINGIPINLEKLGKKTLNELIEWITFPSPIDHLQPTLSLYFSYIESISSKQPQLASDLKSLMIEAIKKSTNSDISPMQDAILEAKRRDPQLPPTIIFCDDEEKHHVYKKMLRQLDQVALKGSLFKKTENEQKGEKLTQMANDTKKKLFLAANTKDPDERNRLIEECEKTSKEDLKKNEHLIETHRNNNYILAEIGIILSSLIVLYPILLTIKYLATKEVGFFLETKTSKKAHHLTDNFEKIKNIK